MNSDVRQILGRLCDYWGASSYKDLAHKLDIGESTPSSWVTKNHIPFNECLMTVEKYECSLDELVFGIKRESINDQAMISAVKEGLEDAHELELVPQLDAKSSGALAILTLKAYKRNTKSSVDEESEPD
ncbi:MAG: hypothetical protein ACI8WB_003413 [Phenylobacterium sp.]|jgi:hypothetical protein